MTPSAIRIRRDLQIRAVRQWSAERGREAAPLVLSPAEKQELARLAELIEFRTPGSQILAEGRAAEYLYLLSDGIVQSSRTTNGGDRQIIAFYWPGDLFGIAEAGIYVNTAEAVTACTVYRFPARPLEQLMLANPNIQHEFFVKAVHDLRSSQRHVVVLGRLNIARRLACFLLDCAGHEHYFDAASAVLTLPMTRYDIADYLGTSAESITRAFAEIERKGLIRRLSPRSLELQLPALRGFADFE